MGQQVILLGNSDKVVLVDEQDYLRLALFRWNLSGYGYAMTPIKPTEYIHIIVARRIGLLGKIDHKDRNKLNNVRSNLREADQAQNGWNAEKREGTTSKYRGVCYEARRNKWEAKIFVRGKKFWLGYFDKEEDAALAYNKAALHHFGEFANINEI